jgi:hypothetical protein
MIKDCNGWSITEMVKILRYLSNTIPNMRKVDINKISNFSKMNQIPQRICPEIHKLDFKILQKNPRYCLGLKDDLEEGRQMRLEVQKTKLLKTTGRVFKFSIRNGII